MLQRLEDVVESDEQDRSDVPDFVVGEDFDDENDEIVKSDVDDDDDEEDEEVSGNEEFSGKFSFILKIYFFTGFIDSLPILYAMLISCFIRHLNLD